MANLLVYIIAFFLLLVLLTPDGPLGNALNGLVYATGFSNTFFGSLSFWLLVLLVLAFFYYAAQPGGKK